MLGSLDFHSETGNIVEANIVKMGILLHTIYCNF